MLKKLLSKENLAKVIIGIFACVGAALGMDQLDPELKGAVNNGIGAVSGLAMIFVARWLHLQEPPTK